MYREKFLIDEDIVFFLIGTVIFGDCLSKEAIGIINT